MRPLALLRTLLVTGLMLGVALPALAQSSDQKGAQFIEFDITRFDSGRKGPIGDKIEGRYKVKFPPLLHLKKSFRPAVAATRADRSLK